MIKFWPSHDLIEQVSFAMALYILKYRDPSLHLNSPELSPRGNNLKDSEGGWKLRIANRVFAPLQYLQEILYNSGNYNVQIFLFFLTIFFLNGACQMIIIYSFLPKIEINQSLNTLVVGWMIIQSRVPNSFGNVCNIVFIFHVISGRISVLASKS